MRKKINFRYFDKALFFTPILIFIIGFLSIYSASRALDRSLGVRQAIWMLVSVLVVFLLARIDYFKLRDFAWPSYLASVFLLIIVLFMPARLGAHRWIGFGGFNFQPSEIAKLSLILVLSNFFANHKPEYISKSKLVIPFAATGFIFLLILKEPDLGTALSLLPILFSMLYFWGFKPKNILIMILLGVLATPIFFSFLKEYQKARLLVFINPNADPLGTGYTIIQSKIAIGSGGIWGKGFLGGTQNQLSFIPERHTDFIFAVIGEEGGLVVCTLVLVLLWFIVYRGYQIAGQTSDRFGALMACGISTMLGTQAIVNLAMTMGLLPVVGVPLPLVSYGGTSIMITMLSIGMLINIKIHRPVF